MLALSVVAPALFATHSVLVAQGVALGRLPERPAPIAERAKFKVYAIVTVTVKPGQDAAFVALLPGDAVRQERAGVRLVASYAVQFGVGNRHIVIWEGDSAEAIRRAAFETSDSPPGILDIIEREDIEIAIRDPTVP